MASVHVFTSAAFNYIPKVRLLVQSLKKFHPDWQFHLALPEPMAEGMNLRNEPFDKVWPIDALDIPHWKAWSFCHGLVELATAIKPFLLHKLLQHEDVEQVIYLDPDIVVFSALDDIAEALKNASIVLTPHQTAPEEHLPAVMDNEICSLKHGIYNLGFIGVANTTEGRRFADWWRKRLYYFCRADIPNGLFTDQRWIDLVPALFRAVHILHDSHYNMASWNLTTRSLEQNPDGTYAVEGKPLVFYHFTGFDSGDHLYMVKKNSGHNRAVLDLVQWYQNATKALAKDPLARLEWAFTRFSNGQAIDNRLRILYRERLDLQAQFPNPYPAEGLWEWWQKNQRKIESQSAEHTPLTPGFNNGYRGVNWQQIPLGEASVVLSQSTPDFGEKVVRMLWKLYRHPRLYWLRSMLSKQQMLAVKNFFSKKSVHEINRGRF
jgi:hypothetical protein